MKKILNSPWTIAIGGAIFSFLLSVGYDLFKGEKLFTTLNFIFAWIKGKIIIILNFDIKFWWILVTAAVFLALYFILAKGNSAKAKGKR